MKTGTKQNPAQTLENDVMLFMNDCNNEVQHLQSDLLQLMSNTFENTTQERYVTANQYSTVHKLYKLLECFKMYHNAN